MFYSYPWGNYTLELGQIVKHHGEIFDFDYPFYDDTQKVNFERDFLLHFRYHEIGQETLQRFKYMLQDVLTTNYPKYKHYYEIDKKCKELEWWNNKTYKTVEERELNFKGDHKTNNKTDNRNNTISNSNGTTNSNSLSKYLETPEGNVSNLDDGYLSNATKDNSSDVSSSTTSSNTSFTNDNTGLSTRDNTEKERISRDERGNIGVTPQGDIVKSWRNDGYINVNKIIFDDCEELFMQIY